MLSSWILLPKVRIRDINKSQVVATQVWMDLNPNDNQIGQIIYVAISPRSWSYQGYHLFNIFLFYKFHLLFLKYRYQKKKHIQERKKLSWNPLTGYLSNL